MEMLPSLITDCKIKFRKIFVKGKMVGFISTANQRELLIIYNDPLSIKLLIGYNNGTSPMFFEN